MIKTVFMIHLVFTLTLLLWLELSNKSGTVLVDSFTAHTYHALPALMLLLLQVTSLFWVTSFCNVLCYTQFGPISLIYISAIYCIMNKLKLDIRNQRESKMGYRKIISMTRF